MILYLSFGLVDLELFTNQVISILWNLAIPGAVDNQVRMLDDERLSLVAIPANWPISLEYLRDVSYRYLTPFEELSFRTSQRWLVVS